MFIGLLKVLSVAWYDWFIYGAVMDWIPFASFKFTSFIRAAAYMHIYCFTGIFIRKSLSIYIDDQNIQIFLTTILLSYYHHVISFMMVLEEVFSMVCFKINSVNCWNINLHAMKMVIWQLLMKKSHMSNIHVNYPSSLHHL